MPASDREILTRRIRDAVDIVSLIGSYLALRRAGANYKGLCPFHEEKTPSFHVHPAKQIFKCYGCGAGGDAFTFVQLREKVDFREARRMLADRAGIDLDREESRGGSPAGPNKTDLARANQWAMRVFRQNYEGSAGESARAYVERRGISVEMAAEFHLGLALDSYEGLIRQAGVSKVDIRLLAAAGLIKERSSGGYYDTFRNRLMFPIVDAAGRMIGFGGRTLADDPAKYLNTPATILFDKSTHLFGLDKAREAISEKGRVVVVEGYTDCMMAHQYGFRETVATLGTAMTEQHAALLRRFSDRVILLFDSDEAGQRAADRALGVSLTGGLDVYLARVPEGKDPCDYLLSAGGLAFDGVLKGAVPALEFKWRLVAQEYQASLTGPGRRRAIDAYLQSLGGWVGSGAIDSIQMGLLVNQLSGLLALPSGEVLGQLSSLRRSPVSPVRSAGSPRMSPSQPGDSEQQAIRAILEVLLNRPDLYRVVQRHLEPGMIRSPELALVARQVVATIEGGEPLNLGDLIGRFELPTLAALVTDLAERGERRGNYEEVVAGAVACLMSAAQARRTTQLAGVLRGQRGATNTDPPEPLSEEEQLLALAASARNPHFASPRARRKFLDT